MPLEGYSDKNAYSETDLNGIISILLNQNDFVNEVDDSICHKARHLLNNLRHNSDMLLSDQMLEDVVCTLQQLLSCCESFKNYSKTSDARAKLEQLKAGSFALPEGYGQQCLQSQILTNDLIQFNKDIHGTIPISPLFEDIDMAVPDVYVQPTINRVLSGCPNAKKGQRTARISSLREIFHDQNGPYREIYLCAETGLGKSVFGKRLALIWSQANESDKIQRSFTQDEIDAINYFDFVFYISLKESDQTHIDVDEMIQQQIIGHLAHATHYSPEFLEHILSDRDRKCLIILDGLDEWSHEKGNIPMRRPRQSCTFLTTTRPWRYTVARIKQSKIDLQLEMIGIDKEGKKALITNILKHFGSCDDQSELENSLKEFEKKVARRNVNDLETSPMLLLYMICLWQDGKPLGDSRCDLYCNILEMLLQKVAQRQQQEVEINQNDSTYKPECFKGKEHCCKNIHFVKKLSHLAFLTLFNQSSAENRLVFNEDIAKKNMSESCIEFWLKTGILTQIVRSKRLTSRDIRISFIHKTFHEFLAALHVAFNQKETNIVIKSCPDINSVLLNASCLQNLCGLSPTASQTVLNGIANVISNSCQTKSLRRNTYAFADYWEMCDLKQDFQNVIVACVNECRDNRHEPRYQLEDVFLNFDGEPESQYVSSLIDLLMHSDDESLRHTGVKSIKFGRALSRKSVHDLRLRLGVDKMKSLQKLDIWGHPCSKDVEMMLGASPDTLECLLLHGCEMKGTKEIERYIEVSEESVNKLMSLKVLESIDLYCISMNHRQIEKVVKWIEGRKSMRQIKIARVKCLDHENNNCVARILDLSEHMQLDVIGVGNMCADQVKVNPLSIREFWGECNQAMVTSFLTDYASSAINIRTLVIEFIDSYETVKKILSTLTDFEHLVNLQLKGLDLQRNELILSRHKTVEHVRLIEITMENQALRSLFEQLSTYKHSVTVEIASCNVEHENGTENYEELRQEIEMSSEKYSVIANLKCSGHDNAFAFRTLSS
ncbi:uncharacterized protein LOC132749026 isoform X1 [Ruditapes philippinarum]|uniref:uncharacterized protein LOC132749026 isoform X1 n=2 Tax=Ruditapes philippinarum TaxID=129788 RepID=UPI00295ADA21|nr:uncharacterized protein LOC132749026 isoform X1 [Ruditapes philippinarum]XP_060594677.1 uncharacterized protein LOC132749026 isoform X1 [Ruditapes philippinarum]